MAMSGLVLAGFVLGHMLGNLQVFLGPEVLNTYAHQLQSLPPPVMWGVRLFLLGCVLVHIGMAVSLAHENVAARPEGYQVKKSVQSSAASRTMIISGIILLTFIIFHLLHFTVRVIYDYSDLKAMIPGVEHEVNDVYAMMISGFSHWWVSIFYLVAMAILCLHLSHGVSSMFQSVGLRNEKLRGLFDKGALLYGWVVFLGFASIPVAVLAGFLK